MKKIFLLILCCLISACGFHLRGNRIIPPDIQRIAVLNTASHSKFQQNLEHDLRLSGAQIVIPERADLIVTIDREAIHKMFESVGTNVQLHQYSLQYAVYYQLKNHQQVTIMPPQHIYATRVYRENANQELGSNNEEQVLINEMQQEVMHKLINQITSENTLLSLHSSYKNLSHDNVRAIKHAS